MPQYIKSSIHSEANLEKNGPSALDAFGPLLDRLGESGTEKNVELMSGEIGLGKTTMTAINSLENPEFRTFVCNLMRNTRDKYEDALAQRIFDSSSTARTQSA